MYIEDYRASKILYNFLVSNSPAGTFLIPANSCPVIPLVFLKAGVKFEFTDISPADFYINREVVPDKISRNPGKYSGLLFIRSYGTLDDMKAFFGNLRSIANELIIIDDRCLCKPSFDREEDNPADLTLFSTGYAKYTDIGMGGFAWLGSGHGMRYRRIKEDYKAADHETMMDRINSSVKNNSSFIYDKSLEWITNESLPADYRDIVIERSVEATVHKTKLNAVYAANLPAELSCGEKYQHWRFNIFVPPEKKEAILSALFSNKLFAGSHYRSVSHIFGQQSSIVAERVQAGIINLFNDFYFTEEMAYRACKIIMENL